MITIIDFEASGLESDSYPIQVAWNIGDVVHSHYINPKYVDAWQGWSVASEAVHQISRSFLDAHGEPPADVAKAMNESLAGCTVYSDAVAYDRNWCQRLFDASPYAMDFTFSDFWTKVAEFAPAGTRGSGHYGMTEWTNMLLYDAKKNTGHLQEHLADNDVRIRMEVMRLAKEW